MGSFCRCKVNCSERSQGVELSLVTLSCAPTLAGGKRTGRTRGQIKAKARLAGSPVPRPDELRKLSWISVSLNLRAKWQALANGSGQASMPHHTRNHSERDGMPDSILSQLETTGQIGSTRVSLPLSGTHVKEINCPSFLHKKPLNAWHSERFCQGQPNKDNLDKQKKNIIEIYTNHGMK